MIFLSEQAWKCTVRTARIKLNKIPRHSVWPADTLLSEALYKHGFFPNSKGHLYYAEADSISQWPCGVPGSLCDIPDSNQGPLLLSSGGLNRSHLHVPQLICRKYQNSWCEDCLPIYSTPKKDLRHMWHICFRRLLTYVLYSEKGHKTDFLNKKYHVFL